MSIYGSFYNLSPEAMARAWAMNVPAERRQWFIDDVLRMVREGHDPKDACRLASIKHER